MRKSSCLKGIVSIGMAFCLEAILAARPLVASEWMLTCGGTVPSSATGLILRPSVAKAGWAGSYRIDNAKCAFPDLQTKRLDWKLLDGKRSVGHGWTALRALTNGTLEVSAAITADETLSVAGVYLALDFPASRYVGCTWRLGKTAGVIPLQAGKAIGLARSSDAQPFTLVRPDGNEAVFASALPCGMLVQDSRRWGDDITVRFQTPPGTFAKGETRRFRVTLRETDGATAAYAEPYVVKRGPDWIPLDYRKDILAESALDFSRLGLQDAPAGKYGWLRNVEGHFEFEKLPGRVQRFYGVNLCFTANYPTHAETDCLVTRLVRLGYNTIRIHHYERDLVKGSADNHAFNPEMMDRLDYLVAKAIEKGLYFTTDLYVSRPVRWRDIGIAGYGEGLLKNKNAYKALVAVHDAAFEDYTRFARDFLLHANPYTGRRYVDEPALPLISLINEGQITMGWNREDATRDLPPMQAAWKAWLAHRRAADPAFAPGVSEDLAHVPTYGRNAVFAQFVADIERANAQRIIAYLRDELKSRALLTDMNCGPHYVPMQSVREELYDYVDDHFYVDHPRFLVRPWSLPSAVGNANPVQTALLSPVRVAWTRTPAQPFCITEWNFAGPGQYRGVGGVMTGALSALQDWSGLWRFAYAHASDDFHDGAGFPGYFNVATDPLGQAGDRASILLFLRRDLEPLARKVALLVTPEAVAGTNGSAYACAPVWGDAAWSRQVSVTASARKVRPGTDILKLSDVARAGCAPFACDPAGGIAFDRARGTFSIATPRTAGGFAPEGELACGAVSFAVTGGAATVWASSLDGAPIASSKRILVTHLTDVQAEGNVYDSPEKKVLVKWGREGTVVRAGRAEVRLAVSEPNAFAVYALETSGRRLGRVPVRVMEGRLVFTADVARLPSATLLYEVVAE